MNFLRALLVATLLAFLAAVVWLGFREGSGSGAVVGVLGLALTAVGTLFTYQTITEQRLKAGRDEVSLRRAQADKISAWSGEAVWRASTPTHVSWDADGNQITRHGAGPVLLEFADLYAHNASDMPVHGFAFHFYVREDGSDDPYAFAGSHSIGVLMPGKTELRLEPASDSRLLQVMARTVSNIPENNLRPPQWRTGYVFTDHAGVRWGFDLTTERVEEARA